MKYIKELNQEQKDIMPLWRDKWIDIGLKTGETDWSDAEEASKVCYEKSNIPWHNNVIRVQSPMVGAFAASIADTILSGEAVHDAVRGEVRDAVYGAVREAVHAAVDGAVNGAVGDAVRDAVRGEVGAAVDGTVYGAVHGAVDVAVVGAVGGEVGAAVGGAVRAAVDGAVDGAVHGAVHDEVRGAFGKREIKWHYWIGGQFWVGGWWGSPSYVSFFTDVCGLELTKDMKERADAYQKLCMSANYVWLNRKFAMICARPTQINRDDQGRLHSETGKAIEYPDGWGLYTINGVVVPEKVIKSPEKLTIKEIQEEENLEVQRIMIQRFGVDKYLIETGAEVVDTDMRGIEGGGARCLMKETNGEQWLVCTDGSTERVYHLSVSRNAKTCRQAHEELCGFNEQLIKMEG